MSSATSRPWLAGRARRGGGSRRACRAPDGRPCDRPRRSRSPRGSRDRRRRRSARCSAPCGCCGRSDGSAAGRARRSPSRRRRRGAPRRRGTCRGGPARRADRGKSSYQALKRARSRSTTSGSSAWVNANRCSAYCWASAPSVGSRPRSRRATASPAAAPSAADQAVSRSASAGEACRATSATSFAPRRAAMLDFVRILPSREVATPRQETIRPGPDRIAVAARRPGPEAPPPAVVRQGRHRDFPPEVLFFGAPEELRDHRVVPVGEAVRLHDDQIAGDPLDRKASAVDLGVSASTTARTRPSAR